MPDLFQASIISDLYWLTDEHMAWLEPCFTKSHGKPRVDDHPVLSVAQDPLE